MKATLRRLWEKEARGIVAARMAEALKMIGRTLLALLIMISAPAGAWAWEGSGIDKFDPQKPHAYTLLPQDEPAWLNDAIARQPKAKADGPQVSNHILFQSKGSPTWLVLTNSPAKGLRTGKAKLEIYRVTRQQLIKAFATEGSGDISIFEPSGEAPFGDGRPVLFFVDYDLSSDPSSSHLRLLSLGDKVRDIAPPKVELQKLEDLDHDGIPELIATDEVWRTFYFDCGHCGPFVPVVYQWRKGRFRETCRSFPSIYASELDYLITEDVKSPAKTDRQFLDHAIAMVLIKLQSGDKSGAADLYARSLTKAKTMEVDQRVKSILAATQKIFGPLIAKADLKAACPASDFKGKPNPIGGWQDFPGLQD